MKNITIQSPLKVLLRTTYRSIPLTILLLIISMIIKSNNEYVFYYIALINVSFYLILNMFTK